MLKNTRKAVIFTVTGGKNAGREILIQFSVPPGQTEQNEDGFFGFYDVANRTGEPVWRCDKSQRGGGEIEDFLFKLLNA